MIHLAAVSGTHRRRSQRALGEVPVRWGRDMRISCTGLGNMETPMEIQEEGYHLCL